MLDKLAFVGSSAAISFLSVTAGSVATTLTGKTNVTLSEVVTVGAVIVLGTWRMATQLSSIKNELRSMSERIKKLEKKNE